MKLWKVPDPGAGRIAGARLNATIQALAAPQTKTEAEPCVKTFRIPMKQLNCANLPNGDQDVHSVCV
jgi:hypothetical protein